MATGSECGITTPITPRHQLVLGCDNGSPLEAVVWTGRMTPVPPQRHPHQYSVPWLV